MAVSSTEREQLIDLINEVVGLTLSKNSRTIKRFLKNKLGKDIPLDKIQGKLKKISDAQVLTDPKKLVIQHSSIAPLHKAYMDLTTSSFLPHGWLLTVIDHYSRYGWVKWLPNKEAKTVATAFYPIFKDNPFTWIIADKGNEWDEVAKIPNVRINYGRPGDTTPNKRFNRTILEKINLLNIKSNDKLEELLETYNNTIHSSTGETPEDILHGNKLSNYKAKRQHWKLRKGNYVRLINKRNTFLKLSRMQKLGRLMQVKDYINGMWLLDDNKLYRNADIQPVSKPREDKEKMVI